LSVAEADDGIEGVQLVREGAIDLVFLDYNMPGLNGLATLAELKRARPDVDVIIMTSAPDEALAARAMRAGATGFLRKPFFPADIDAVLYARYGLTPCAHGAC
jgi:CheY-like chemotaxis protein